MMTLTKHILMALTTTAVLAYLIVLIQHERGRIDARKWRFLLIGSEPGGASKRLLRRYYILAAGVAVFTLTTLLGISFSTLIGWPLLMLVVVLIARKDDLQVKLEAFFARRTPAKAHAICLALVIFLEWTSLEIPGNLYFVSAMLAKPLSLIVELVVLTLITLTIWLIAGRRRQALLIPAVVCCVIGIAEYFVILFKEIPILPSDLLALGTAATVGAKYTYTICDKVLLSVAAVWGVYFIPRCAKWDYQRSVRTTLTSLATAVACALVLVLGFTQIDFVSTFGIIVRAWCPVLDYESYGFIPAFTAGVQTIPVQAPEGYSRSKTEKLVARYAADYDSGEGASEGRQAAEAQWKRRQPNVIVVMDETFSDFSIFDDLHAGYTGPDFFNSCDDYLMRGTMYVSAFGGGTCNTEFEFLTGNSMNYIGMSVYPYSVYNMAGVAALPQQFDAAGYMTTAIHPNLASNWNRNIVYPEFGFQQFLDIDSFRDAETIRGYATDRATYASALSLIKNNDAPQFIFDVTMQNHGGYTTGEVPPEMQVSYTPGDVNNDNIDQLTEYLSLIRQSDIQLEEFLDELRQLREPTIVIFWGDHQPYFGGRYNDAYYTGESEIDHTQRLWQTKYMVWANYDVAGADRIDRNQDLSVNYFASTVLEAVGAPLTDVQKAQQTMRHYIPCINMIGYMDSTGSWHYASETGAKDYKHYQELNDIQYLTLFDFDHPGGLYLTSTGPGQTDPNVGVETTEGN